MALRGNRGPGSATCSPSQIDAPPPPISLYCTGIIPVEERAHSPPPPTIFCWEPGLRLGLCALSARGRSSRGIYHASTFDGGGVFYTASSFSGGWPNICAIDAEPPFYGTPMIGCRLVG